MEPQEKPSDETQKLERPEFDAFDHLDYLSSHGNGD
jgi:hypothetical protein